jgi:acyl carrier protein
MVTDSTPLQIVSKVWAEVLGTDVDEYTDFFLVGGHSLLATQMIARVERALGVKVTFRQVLDNPKMADFVKLVTQLSATPLSTAH